MATPLSCLVVVVVVVVDVDVVCAARRGPERQTVLQVFGCFMCLDLVAP